MSRAEKGAYNHATIRGYNDQGGEETGINVSRPHMRFSKIQCSLGMISSQQGAISNSYGVHSPVPFLHHECAIWDNLFRQA